MVSWVQGEMPFHKPLLIKLAQGFCSMVMGHGSSKRANVLNSNLNKLETQKGEPAVKTEEAVARAGCHTSVNVHKAPAPSHCTCVVKIASRIESGLDQ